MVVVFVWVQAPGSAQPYRIPSQTYFLTHQPNEPYENNAYKATPLLINSMCNSNIHSRLLVSFILHSNNIIESAPT